MPHMPFFDMLFPFDFLRTGRLIEAMAIEIIVAEETAKPLLRSLLSDYLTELGAFGEVNLEYPYFEAYWRPGTLRWPYFIHCHSRLIGFAFVRSARYLQVDFSMAEFFIRPQARGYGYGIAAATAIMRLRPGKWEVAIIRRNAPAQKFWPKAISAAGAGDVKRSEERTNTSYTFTISA
jgi:predicted acetyltransferase